MNWSVTVAREAVRNLLRFPNRDHQRLTQALEEMRTDPFAGDVVRLRAQPAAYRRRVGSYRILFDVVPESRRVSVQNIVRRSSTTY